MSANKASFTAGRAGASRHLLELFEDGRVFQRRDVLLDLLALRDRAQQPPHDLARARLRQVVAEADVLRLGDGTDLLADPVAQLLRDFQRLVAARAGAFQHHERAHRLARQVVRTTHDRGLRDELGVRHQRRLDLHRAEPVSGDVQHVVDAPHDAEIAVRVGARAVSREVVLALEVLRVVALPVTLRIAPDGADHGGPRALDHQDAALAFADRVAGFVDDVGDDSGQRQRRRSGLGRYRARQRGNHVAAGLGLPPRIDIGQRPPPTVSWYHIQASGLIGSPTVPRMRSDDRLYFFGRSPPALMSERIAVGAV